MITNLKKFDNFKTDCNTKIRHLQEKYCIDPDFSEHVDCQNNLPEILRIDDPVVLLRNPTQALQVDRGHSSLLLHVFRSVKKLREYNKLAKAAATPTNFWIEMTTEHDKNFFPQACSHE